MPWKRMMFKGNKVYAEVDESGKVIVRNGRVRVRYKEDDHRVYEASAGRVEEIDEEKLKAEKERRRSERERRQVERAELEREAPRGLTETRPLGDSRKKDEVRVFCDGASSGNPGPAGIGVVLKYRQHTKTISKHVGTCTNNEAELLAVKEGLEALKNPRLPVRLFVDSEYVQGVLRLGWKARANAELVYEIREMMKKFADLEIVVIKGHQGQSENELADSLAWKAAQEKR